MAPKRVSIFLRRLSTLVTGIHSDTAGLIGISVLFLLMCLPFFSYVPLWDGQGYARCAMDASLFPLSVDNARCFGHPAIAYVWYQRVFQLLSPHSIPLLYTGNVVLMLASAVIFLRLLRFLFPRISSAALTLYIALFLFTPILTVHLFHVTPDTGVVCFFMMYLSFLIRGKYRSAAIAALALTFSKEVGAAVYLASLACLPFLVASAFHRESWIGRAHLTTRLLPLLLPLFPLALYLKAYSSNEGGVRLWENFSSSSVDWRMIFFFDPTDGPFLGYLNNMFVLNFQWVFVAVIVAAVFLFLFREAAGVERRNNGHMSRLIFLGLLTFAVAYIVTRARPYNNARYTVAMIPLLLTLFPYAMESLRMNKHIQEMFLSVTVTALFLSNFSTIDPVSRLVYGVFDAGGQTMLNMNHGNGSQATFGRDEMAYNMQFLIVTDTLRQIMKEIKPSEDTLVFAGYGFNFQLPFVSQKTGDLTLNPDDSFQLSTTDDAHRAADLQGNTNRKAYYISFPNIDSAPLADALRGYGELTELTRGPDSWHGVRLYLFKPLPTT